MSTLHGFNLMGLKRTGLTRLVLMLGTFMPYLVFSAITISSPGSVSISTGDEWEYRSEVTAPAGIKLTYSLNNAPVGMRVLPSGRIFWTPMIHQIGSHAVDLVVAGDNNESGTTAFTINVTEGAPDPVGIYVAPNGDDNGDGSAANPFKTVQRASVVLQYSYSNPEGRTVYIRGGLHVRDSSYIGVSGTEAEPITFKAYGNEKPKIKRLPGSDPLINIHGSHLKFEGLELEGTSADITYEQRIATQWESSRLSTGVGFAVAGNKNVTIQNCVVHHFGEKGVSTWDTDYTRVIGCIIYNNTWWQASGTDGYGANYYHPTDLSATSSSVRAKIHGNLVFGNENRIFLAGRIAEGRGILIELGSMGRTHGESSMGLGKYVISHNICLWNGYGGIGFEWSYNGEILNNTIYGNGTTAGDGGGGNSQEFFYKANTGIRLWNNKGDLMIKNNAIHTGENQAAIGFESDNFRSLTVENNYVVGGFEGGNNEHVQIAEDGCSVVTNLFEDPEGFDFSTPYAGIGIGQAEYDHLKTMVVAYGIDVKSTGYEMNYFEMAEDIESYRPEGETPVETSIWHADGHIVEVSNGVLGKTTIARLRQGTLRGINAVVPEGLTFIEWTGDIEHLDNPNSAHAICTMPGYDVSYTGHYSVNVVNHAPVAVSNKYRLDEGTVLNISAPGVLANDIDADSDPLTAVLVKDASNGTLVLNANGSFEYTPHAGYIGTDSFKYKVNDGTDVSNIVKVKITVNAAEVIDDNEDSDQVDLKMDMGVASVNGTWITVNLPQVYTSPVVVCTVNINNNTLPVLARVQNVRTTSFEVKLQNPSGAEIVADNVHYLVMEEGAWQLPDGRNVEASLIVSEQVNGKDSWDSELMEEYTYQNEYTAPVVLGQVMTANDRWSTFWSSNGTEENAASSMTCYVGKHVGEDTDNIRTSETLAVIVIEEGPGFINGVPYEAKLGTKTVEGVTEAKGPYSYALTGFSLEPVVGVISQATMNGGDGSWAVLAGPMPLTPTSVDLGVDEDLISDSEGAHTDEQVGYIIFESAISFRFSGE